MSKDVRDFQIGREYYITHYPSNKVQKLRIVSRNKNRVSYSIDNGDVKEYKIHFDRDLDISALNKVCYPPSESLLIDDYSAVFSYNYIGCDDINITD